MKEELFREKVQITKDALLMEYEGDKIKARKHADLWADRYGDHPYFDYNEAAVRRCVSLELQGYKHISSK